MTDFMKRTIFFIFTIDSDIPEDMTPEAFGDDMNKLFGSDPEKDIISKVFWWNELLEEESWCRGAVIVSIRKDMTKEEACRTLSAYKEEKKIDYMNLMFNGGDGLYDFICCDSPVFEENEKYSVMITDDTMIMPDGEDLWLGEETEPGFCRV